VQASWLQQGFAEEGLLTGPPLPLLPCGRELTRDPEVFSTRLSKHWAWPQQAAPRPKPGAGPRPLTALFRAARAGCPSSVWLRLVRSAWRGSEAVAGRLRSLLIGGGVTYQAGQRGGIAFGQGFAHLTPESHR